MSSSRLVLKQRIPVMITVAIVAIAVLGVGVVVVDLLEKQRQASNRTDTKNDLKRIMLAMHQYHDEHQTFPPAFVVGPDGKRWHSWRALLLPYLEPELARQYDFGEPWNGPENSKLLAVAPDSFQSECVDPPASATSYYAVVGRKTLWPTDQSVGFRNIVDGTSNTIAVVEDTRVDTAWLEPRDLLPGEFMQSFYHGPPCAPDGRTVALADGSTRFLSQALNSQVVSSLLTPAASNDTYKGSEWPFDLIEKIAEQSLNDPVDSNNLLETQIVAASTAKLDTTGNQIWAATFQMVWDQLKSEVGGPVTVSSHEQTVEQLNASSFDIESLSPSSYVLARTGIRPDDDARLLADLKRRFPDVDASVHEIEDVAAAPGLRLYSLIRKQMPFEANFLRFKTPLKFVGYNSSHDVISFGCDPSLNHSGTDYRSQLEILDDRGDDNFIVQLTSIGPQRDRIILGLVPPAESLEATWLMVKDRIQKPHPRHDRRHLESDETLQIPIIDFSVQKHFEELEGQPVGGFAGPMAIVVAFMDIRLRLDETGAEFTSQAELGLIGEFGDEEPLAFDPRRIRRLIFNRPFFIAMKEPGDTQPWFLGWIANAEMMDAFDQK